MIVDADLDPAQRGAVRAAVGGAMLVLGEAGHGKTTVAVHRVAHLFATGAPRTAVIVPTPGLARFVQSMLRKLGVDVKVETYDAWAARQARRAFPDLPRRESDLTPSQIARMKRDPALRVALDELAAGAPSIVDDDVDAPRVRSRAHARRADLQHLFGDRALVERVLRATSIPPRVIDDVLDRTRVQFSPTAEREYAHVTDRARLIAVDERAMDDGTASANAGTVDVEDYAVLFELDRLRATRLGRAPTAPRAFDVIAVDEAQELAPLELALVGRSLAPGGTLVVAGDADQQVDPTTSFFGWERTMRELGVPDYASVHLDVGYRCPPAVAAFARTVVGDDVPSLEGGPACVAFDDERALAERIGREARALQRRDPRASIIVICRSPLFARRFADRARAEVPTRLVFDGRFLPRGPVQVTTVDETRGLEFDFVVVPDATADAYPDTPASRRALYVAVTRARHQVLLAHAGRRTPIVPDRV
jgi:DNA helicase IV